MSGIEDVLKNVLKSKVIVYDLARGEIEVDFYLPVDVRTLNSISEISLRKYIPDMTRMQMIPKSKYRSFKINYNIYLQI
jgi:hypothetical protein